MAPSTLRTWDRRYGLGPSSHTVGTHRRYSVADLHRLVVMRRLTLEGVPTAEAAEIARGLPDPSPPGTLPAGPVPGHPVPGHPVPGNSSAGPVPGGTAAVSAAVAGVPARLPVPSARHDNRMWPHGVGLPLGAMTAHPDGAPAAGRTGGAGSPGLVAPPGLPQQLMSPLGSAQVPTQTCPPPGQAPAERPPTGQGSRSAGTGAAGATGAASPSPAAPPATSAGSSPEDRVIALLAAGYATAAEQEPALPAYGVAGRYRRGGGQVIALPAGSPQARGLARAAMALDSHEVARILAESIALQGVERTWTGLAAPVLQAVGDRWRTTGKGVDVEHLFTETLLTVLRMAAATRRVVRSANPVLLACPGDELHTLPVHALAAALAERGAGCRLLGGRVPAEALVSAVRRTGPSVVYLHASMPVAAAPVLETLTRQRPAPRLLLGGPGWRAERVAASVTHVASLAEAVDEVLLTIPR